MVAQADLFDTEVKPEKKPQFSIRPYQQTMVDNTFGCWEEANSNLTVMATGLGKCLGRGTKVMLDSGRLVAVEDVRRGDSLMGPDSKPRLVLSTSNGVGPLYKITPHRGGDPFIVNDVHVLTLKVTSLGSTRPSRGAKTGLSSGAIIDIPLNEYLAKNKYFKHLTKGFRVQVDFAERDESSLPVDPYFLGLWLGDGTSAGCGITTADEEIVDAIMAEAKSRSMGVNKYSQKDNLASVYRITHGPHSQSNPLTNDLRSILEVDSEKVYRRSDGGTLTSKSLKKRIPHIYKTGSRETRRAVLAGLIDTDGSYADGCFEFSSKNQDLAGDVAFVARSLGFAASVTRAVKECVNNGVFGTYWRVVISGHCCLIPTRIHRKKAGHRWQKKNHLMFGFTVEPVGEGEYFGFTLSDDGRFLLGDFTVTHNTASAAYIAKRITENDEKNYLFFAHRNALIEQAYATMRAVNPRVSVSIEQGEMYADIRVGRRSHIVVASKDSLHIGRLGRYPKDFFSHITADEAHHAVGTTYTRVFDYFTTAKYHGITATPDRADEAALGQVFESVAFEYGILDGIKDGYLVPIVQQLEYVEGFDLSDVRENASGDLKESDIADEMRSKKMLHATATAAVKYSMLSNGFETRRPTLIFCASVEHAEEVANILNDWHAREGSGRAATINSTKMTTDDVKATVRAFRAGEIQYLTNMGIATEGADFPMVRVVVIARMTKSRSLYEQMVGRVIRPLTEIVPELNAAKDADERKALIRASRKPGGLIVDLVGNSGKHKLITALDILGGKYDDDVIEKAKANIMARGGRADVDGMQEEMERVDTKAKVERRAGVILKAKLSSRIVDPFDLLDVSSTREPGWFKGKSPTDKMKAMLERNKFTDKEIKEMSFFKAKQVIGKIIERREKGLCSLPQAKTLAKYGFNPDMPFEQAKQTIDRIAASGWKLRGDFDPSNN